VTDAGGFVAFGTDHHGFAGVESAFGFDKTAGLTHLAGLDVLGYDIPVFDDDFAFFGADRKHFAFFPFFFAADYHDCIVFSDVHITHFQKFFLSRIG